MDISAHYIAKKYAKAFLKLYNSHLDERQITYAEEFISFLTSHKRALFYASFIPQSEEIKNIFSKYFKEFKLLEIWLKLIDILQNHKRLDLLPLVFNNIIKFYNQNQKIYSITVASSIPLTENGKIPIINFLKEKIGSKVKINFIVDKSLIAGIKIYNDTLRWEYSIAKQIKLLKHMH